VERGSFVAQGDIIGFVGSSGLASGPHLHYEFRQHGVARDPRQVNGSSGEPIPAALRPLFQAERDRLVGMLRPVPADLDLAAGSD
jgi:murein DD-endopeptidase MepM/ murein hydrolase activator NlpD